MKDYSSLIQQLLSPYNVWRAGDHSWRSQCPIHKGDNPTSFSIFKNGRYHCLSAETNVITTNGVVPISSLDGSAARVITTDSRGYSNWVDANFYSFGVQKLYKILIGRNGVEKEIFATSGHRWFRRSRNGRYIESITTALEPGHRLKSSSPPRSGNISLSPWGVAHGFAFGDGTRSDLETRVIAWGEKDQPILKYFPLSNKIPVKTDNGIHGHRIHGLPLFFKEFPYLYESPSYLYGWLAGYFAADGCVAEEGTPTLASANKQNLEYVRNICNLLGIFTYGIKEQLRLGLGVSPSKLFSVAFARKTLSETFFIVDSHRERWLKNNNVNERRGWVVRSVVPTDREEQVFCAIVPDTHSFVLEDNILTGNCFRCGASGDMVHLVQAVKRLTLKQAQDYVGSAPVAIVTQMPTLPATWKEAKSDTKYSVLREATLGPYRNNCPVYLIDRGFSETSLKRYGVGYDMQQARIVIPVRDYAGKLVGLTYRIDFDPVDENKKIAKYWHDQFQKTLHLYGFNLWADKEIDRLFIVEGQLDVIRMWQLGHAAVAIMGDYIDEHQIQLLRRRCKAKRIVLAFDNDGAGKDCTTSTIAKLSKTQFGRELGVLEYPGKDPGQLTEHSQLKIVAYYKKSHWMKEVS